MLKFKTAKFLKSIADPHELSTHTPQQIAFIGRSNVGKSSLINYLTGKKNLAKISGKPGKTQLINLFLIDEKFYLVDLPGYGFAKASQKKQKDWSDLIDRYLSLEKNRIFLLFLLDIRRTPSKEDTAIFEWIEYYQIPFLALFTKYDKINKTKQAKHLEIFLKSIPDIKNFDYVCTSILEKKSRGDVIKKINQRMQWD